MRRKKPKGPVIIPPPTTPGIPLVNEFFNAGSVPPNWTVSNWSAPMGGKFQTGMVTFDKGMLGMKLTQDVNPDGSYLSIGGEIKYNTLCGYGTYEWVARSSSSANSPTATGYPFSGSVTGLFNYVNDSQTEIDLEIEGCRPNIVHATNWSTTMANKSTRHDNVVVLDTVFHSYKYVWVPGKISFYLDNFLIAEHTENVPSTPAYPMINHWGTNNANWGGTVTLGVSRYIWVKQFSFTPL